MAFVSSSPSPRPIASATSSRPYLRANSSSRARSSLEGCVDLIASLLRFSQWSDQVRSEEHTSELQSQSNIVCRLLLEKKKAYITTIQYSTTASPFELAASFRPPFPHPDVVCVYSCFPSETQLDDYNPYHYQQPYYY